MNSTESTRSEKVRFDHYGPLHQEAGIFLLWFKRGTENLLAGILVEDLQTRLGIADLSDEEIKLCCAAHMSRLEQQVQSVYETTGGQPGDILLKL